MALDSLLSTSFSGLTTGLIIKTEISLQSRSQKPSLTLPLSFPGAPVRQAPKFTLCPPKKVWSTLPAQSWPSCFSISWIPASQMVASVFHSHHLTLRKVPGTYRDKDSKMKQVMAFIPEEVPVLWGRNFPRK